MKRSVLVTLLAVAVCLGLAVTRAGGYPNYYDVGTNPQSGGCYQCHPTFDQRGTLHTVHVGSSKMTSNCSVCHISTGDNPLLNSSALDPAHGCDGCHVGRGLRKHHQTAGAPADAAGRHCNDPACHGSEPAPVGENVLPPYYSSTEVRVHDPCLSSSAAGGEHWDGDLVDLNGLDNDGDGVYEAQDADCRTTGVPESGPAAFEFAPPFPNPARDRVVLDLSVPQALVARVVVYDQAGRVVRVIADRRFEPGRYPLEWDMRDGQGHLARSGIYFVVARAADMTQTRTMVFIR